MSLLKQLVARLARLRLRSNKSLTITNVTPKLCLLPTPAFQLALCPPATLDDMPPELIVAILELAGPETIVSATAVSRRFREIVGSSSSLQYRVALVLAGMHDRGDHAPSGDRLRALNARSAAWRSFQYRDRLTLDIGPGALRPCYDLHNGIFFVGRRTGPNLPIRTLTWLPLPSLDNPVAGLWQSVSLDISIDDFALDLRQDLLILVEMLVPTATMVHIHLRSFQSLSAHPKAASSSLTLDCAPVSGNSTIVVDLSGKHLGLLFSHDHQARSDHDRICVWDWTTGETVFFLQGSSTKLTSFVFLMDDVLLVPDVAANALSVFTRNAATGQFELGEMFGLPDLAEGCVLHNANSRYKSRGVHQPGAGAHALPGDAPGPGFYVAPEMELVVISLEYRADGWSHFFTLICPKSTFLNPTRSRPAVAAMQQPRLALAPPAIPSPVPAAVAVAPPLIHMPASTVASPLLLPHTTTIPPPGLQLQPLPTPSLDLPAPADAPLPAATNPAVPWESWGPISTRLIREPLRLWDYFHASTRFLALTASSSGGVDDEDSATGTQRTLTGSRAHLRVLDFHPGVVAKAGGRSAEPSPLTEHLHHTGTATREAVRATTPHPRESWTTNDGLPIVSTMHESSSRDAAGPSTRPAPAPPVPATIQQHQHSAIPAQPPAPDVEAGTMEGPTRRIRVVRGTAPNVVRAGPVFFQDVFTRLPYVETTTTSAFDIANVLCDHERVIGLKTNDLLDMESLDVFLL